MDETQFLVEVMNELEDRFSLLNQNCEKYIYAMQSKEEYKENVTEFFRAIHSIKALVMYAKIENVTKTIVLLEDVLSILRSKNEPINQEIADWLYQISDYFVSWHESIQKGALDEMKAVDSYTMNMIKAATISSQKPSEILKKLTVVLIETDKKVQFNIVKQLSKKVYKLYNAKNSKDVTQILSKTDPDILITTTQVYGAKFSQFVDTVQKIFVNMPIVFLSSQTDLNKDKKFRKDYSDCFIEKPFEMHDLEKKLLDIAKKYYDSKEIKVKDHDLTHYIASLKPLPRVVFELQNILADANSDTKKIADIISTEPVLTAKMLQVINSSMYSLTHKVTSIRQAISLLGRVETAALSMRMLMFDQLEIKLESYGIDQDIFNRVSKKRLDLAMHWCSKVSLSLLPTVCTSALIGNIGQILIDQEVQKRELQLEFVSALKESNSIAAEVKFFKTTYLDLTADILEHWGMDSLLVDSIRYAYDFTECSDEVKQAAIINYVIYNTINPLEDEIDLAIVADMADFLEEMNFSTISYLKAVEKINC